jgi:hypothetical protein
MQHRISFRAVHRVQLGNAAGFSKYIGIFLVFSTTATVFIHLSVTVISLCYCLHPAQGHLSSTTVFIHLSVIVTHYYSLHPVQCHCFQPLLLSSSISVSQLSASASVFTQLKVTYDPALPSYLSQCHCYCLHPDQCQEFLEYTCANFCSATQCFL